LLAKGRSGEGDQRDNKYSERSLHDVVTD
jgi:hypothetical protein